MCSGPAPAETQAAFKAIGQILQTELFEVAWTFEDWLFPGCGCVRGRLAGQFEASAFAF